MAAARRLQDSPDDQHAQVDSIERSSLSSTEDQYVDRNFSSNSEPASGATNYLEFVGNKTADSEMITVEINLTDPDDLARKLDMVDLTDEETDLLLEKAQELNVWLRHQLMRQSSAVGKHHRHSATCIVSAPAAAALSDDDDKVTVDQTVVRRARTFSGNSSLPPLVRQQGHPSSTAAYVSYSRAETSPLSPYYSKQGPGTTNNMRRMPPTLYSVPNKLTASLQSSAAAPRADVSTRKSRFDTSE